MSHMLPRLITVAILFSSVAIAQTTGVPGVNDMTINGQGSGGTSCIAVDSVAGDPWNLAISTLPFTPMIGALAFNCQPGALNINATYSVDLDLPSTNFVFDGTGLLVNNGMSQLVVSNSFGGWTLGITTQELFSGTVGFQMGFVNVTFPNGIGTSQAFDVTFGPLALVPNGIDLAPLSDDGSVNVAFASTPFSFYGTSYTDLFVNMNGNVTFTAGDTDWTANGADMIAGAPRIAPAWDDWTPSDVNQGTVRVFDDGSVFAVEWYNVRHFPASTCGSNTDSNTFAAYLDLANGDIDFHYGAMLLCQQGGNASTSQVVGLSPGNGIILNNVDLTAGFVALPNQPIYEDFGLVTFGAFDLSHLTCCFNQVLHFAAAGNGYSVSLQ